MVFGRHCLPNQACCLLGSPEFEVIGILFYFVAHSIVAVKMTDDLILLIPETPGIVYFAYLQIWVEMKKDANFYAVRHGYRIVNITGTIT